MLAAWTGSDQGNRVQQHKEKLKKKNRPFHIQNSFCLFLRALSLFWGMQRKVRQQPRSCILWLWCHLVPSQGLLPARASREKISNCSKNHCYCLPCKQGAAESPHPHPHTPSPAFLWGWEAEPSLELQELKGFLPGTQGRRGCRCKANFGEFWITLRTFWSFSIPLEKVGSGHRRMRECCTTSPKTWL